MIFAHAPAGWLTANWVRRLWKRQPISKHATWWFLVVAAVGGVFPDLDLLYSRFVSAELAHRQLVTHTPLVYVALLVVGWLITRLLKKPFWSEAVWCFVLGAVSHLITDSVGGFIMWGWPVSRQGFGLFSIPFIANSAQAPHLLFYSFLMEGIWFAVFIWCWGNRIFSRTKILVWKILAVIFILSWWGIFIETDLHTAHSSPVVYFSDQDQDGILNMADTDLDGDGLPSISDTDADGDGVSNAADVASAAQAMVGVWTDPTDGGAAQILSHIGFITNGSLPTRAFAQAGFFWRQAMTDDYQLHPNGYFNAPTAVEFDTTSGNRRSFFVHQGSLTTGLALNYQQIQVGDLLFLAHGQPEALVVAIDEHGIQTVRAQTGRGTSLEVITPEEFPYTVLASGRVWL